MIYTPKAFENNDIEQLQQVMEQFNFATLISQFNHELQASHLPMMLDRTQGLYGTLKWHVAISNPHAELNSQQKSLCIFHGPHAYISPSWYKNFSVPTWNYVVVHAQGFPKKISQEQLVKDLNCLIKQHEAKIENERPYNISEEYIVKLLPQIVGFEMEITELHGKFKLGQNRSLEDQQGFLQGLKQQINKDALALADFIEQCN